MWANAAETCLGERYGRLWPCLWHGNQHLSPRREQTLNTAMVVDRGRERSEQPEQGLIVEPQTTIHVSSMGVLGWNYPLPLCRPWENAKNWISATVGFTVVAVGGHGGALFGQMRDIPQLAEVLCWQDRRG